jgi:O-antigen/teichoic acid export membrane protein
MMGKPDTGRPYQEIDSAGATLSVHVMKGSLWLFLLRFATRLLDLIRVFILARLLVPADFGLLGAALVVIGIFEMFTLMGIDTAIIQKKEGAETYLDTAWTMQIVRYLLIGLGVFLSAPYAARYFEMPEVGAIVRVLVIIQLIRGFRNIGPIYFRKNMQFNKWFGYVMIPVAVDFLLAVPAAIYFRNVWALVFGLMGRELTGFTLSYAMHPYRPRLDFNFDRFKEVFNFGKWILGSGILSFIVVQGPFIVIAKMIGAASLGTYQMAHRIAVVTMTEMVRVVSNSVFPAFSLIQDDTIRLRHAYARVSRLVIFILLPALVSLLLLSKPFTLTVLGEKWSAVIPILKLLALSGVLRALVDMGRPYLLAKGSPHFQFKRDLIYASSTILFIYPLTRAYGLEGAALSQILAVASVFVFDLVYMRRRGILFGGDFSDGAREYVPVILAAAINAAVVWALMHLYGAREAFFVFAALIGVAAYAGVQYLFEKMGSKAVLHDLLWTFKQRSALK